MSALEVQVGSTIMNQFAAVRVQARGETGWTGLYISLAPEHKVTMTGMDTLVPDEDLPSFRHVPFEWTPCPDGVTEERYAWTKGCRSLAREERRIVAPTVDGIRGHMLLTPEEDEAQRQAALLRAALRDDKREWIEGEVSWDQEWPNGYES